MKRSSRLPERARSFVTGGGSGLGRAFCLELAKRGARLIVADLDFPSAQETCRLALENGATSADPLLCDVRRKQDLLNAAQKMVSNVGGVDLLINNAGVAVGGDFMEISDEDWRWQMSVNFEGVLSGCQVFLPLMREQGIGRILNIASAAGFANAPQMSPYNVSKAAVISLSESLLNENSAHGIHVTVVCPTFFPTKIAENARMTNPAARKSAEFLLHDTRETAERVARAALRDLESERFFCLPMREARAIALVKRLFPGLFRRLLTFQMTRLQRKLAQ